MKTFLVWIVSTFLFSSVAFAGQDVGNLRPVRPQGIERTKQLVDVASPDAPQRVGSSYEKSPAAGPVNMKAQYALGISYLEGKGKALNCMEAAHWLELAAKQGLAEAQYQLGLLYEKGKGVPQDYAKAAHWYKKSAKQDYVLAQNALGFLYYNGKGVPRDLVISLALFNIASARGNADAFQNSYIAASNMPFKNFNKAKHLALNRKQLYAMIGG